jgi:hypothetical protein
LTGEAKYMNEVELTMFNDLIGHQHSDGIQWVYYSVPNDTRLDMYQFHIKYHCCASSLPRAIEMFSSHLTGRFDDALSIASLSPAEVKLSEEFGGGTLEIKGNYPIESSAEIHFKPKQTKRFTVEFHLPVFTKLGTVKVNGTTTIAIKNDRGFYELEKEWKKGDVLSIDMNYLLKATIQLGENDSRWLAFNYGPLALAERITGEPTPQPEPFVGIDTQTTPSEYAAMLTETSDRVFTIKDTKITLIPYSQTCSNEARPRTYFKL